MVQFYTKSKKKMAKNYSKRIYPVSKHHYSKIPSHIYQSDKSEPGSRSRADHGLMRHDMASTLQRSEFTGKAGWVRPPFPHRNRKDRISYQVDNQSDNLVGKFRQRRSPQESASGRHKTLIIKEQEERSPKRRLCIELSIETSRDLRLMPPNGILLRGPVQPVDLFCPSIDQRSGVLRPNQSFRVPSDWQSKDQV